MNIGKLILMLRAAEGLSQAELAARLGVSRAHLSQIENGHKQPSLPLVRGLAEIFQIPVAVLLADENDAESDLMATLREMLGSFLVTKISLARVREVREKKKRARLKA